MAYNDRNNNRRGGFSGGNRNDFANRGRQEPEVIQHIELTEKGYVDQAEEIITKKLKKDWNGKPVLTTSKIRNILGMFSSLYDEVIHVQGDKLPEELEGRIQYLRLHIAYEAGRDNNVRDFVINSDLLYQVAQIGDSKKKFMLCSKYMEALVAYHRFHGGRD